MFSVVSAQDNTNWFSATAPALQKIIDLSLDPPTDSNNVDCAEETYIPLGETDLKKVCKFMSPLGSLTTSGQIDIGANRYVDLAGPEYHSYFIPNPDESMAYVSLSSPGIGDYVGVYRHLLRQDLHEQHNASLDDYYQVTRQPDMVVRDPTDGSPLMLSVPSIAFSQNGEWMVASAPHRGLILVNTVTFSVQLFTRPIEPSWYLGLATPALAVSDDGRYVAANTDLFGTGNIIVYDTTSCGDQFNAPAGQTTFCAGQDIWHGVTTEGQSVNAGLLGDQPDLQRPSHIRFVNDSNISFSAWYGNDSGPNHQTAYYTATASGGMRHGLGLLALGDSYISGEGEYDYRIGTDTAANRCHLSSNSYPLTLGFTIFDNYGSIACSGATINKVMGNDKFFGGQVNDGMSEYNRDKPTILANFQPGYIYQQEFASAYTPEAMLVSIGGNDIGFAGIIKSCVANSSGGTCYDTYEDRAELVNEIDATYAKLVRTYTTLRQQSAGGRLYVVGYPQIVQPGGSCGLDVHLNQQEVQFASQLTAYLDDVIRQAASTAGVVYVDTQQAFNGHKLCQAGDKAVNGLTIGTDSGVTIAGHTINFVAAESYHPTQLGHRLLAATIASQTDNLSSPMPIPATYHVPIFDPGAPILQNVTHSGRQINWVTHDDTMANDLMIRGDSQQVTVDGGQMQLQPQGGYKIVLHSAPLTLAAGNLDANGDLSVQVRLPLDVPAGYHTIHLYANDMAGQPVDIQKVVYVAASATDYNGDGIVNDDQACSVIPDFRPADMAGPAVCQNASDLAATKRSDTPPAAAHKGDTVAISGAVLRTPATIAAATSVLHTALVSGNGSQAANLRLATPAESGPAAALFRLDWLAVGLLFLMLSGIITCIAYVRTYTPGK